MLVDAIFTEEDRSSVIEDKLGHLVHVAYDLEHEVFILSQQLDLQYVHELSQSLTVLFIVSDHQVEDL